MIFNVNTNEYKDLICNSVFQYSSSMKKAIVRRLKEDGKVTFSKKRVRVGCKYPILCEDNAGAIDTTVSDNDFLGFYENWDFEKTYKYSVPLICELNLSEGITFNELVSSLVKDGKIIIFSENDKFNIPNSISTDISECTPYYKKDGNYALFKFLIIGTTLDENFEQVRIRYPIIISINLENDFVEIRFDGGKFDLNSRAEYITPKIKYCIDWLKGVLCLKVYNVNADNTIDTIKKDTSGKTVVQKQFMEMKSGGSAELTASEDKGYVLPFIGDLRQLIKDNEPLFDESPEIKKLLDDFLDDKEETADYPYVHVRWLNQKKSHEFTVKIVFKYYDMKYIQMHNMQSSARVTKERMEYAIEYLFESGSFTKGEEIQ